MSQRSQCEIICKTCYIPSLSCILSIATYAFFLKLVVFFIHLSSHLYHSALIKYTYFFCINQDTATFMECLRLVLIMETLSYTCVQNRFASLRSEDVVIILLLIVIMEMLKCTCLQMFICNSMHV